ncbi:MAG: hypothetical protein ABI565_14510, partial [Vicinamibacteria bacterium]
MADREPNPLVDQIRKGGVPLEVRLMAAEGALPLKPEDLVDLLELMHRDPLPEVSALATKTFSELSVETLLPLIKARDASLAVLGWTLKVRTDPKILEACLQNTSTADEAIAEQASRLPENLAELVVINQTRLLRHPPLLERIEANPMLSRDQRRRLAELRETFSIGVTPEPEAQPQPQAPAPPAPPPPPPVEAAPAPMEAAIDENLIELKPEEAAQSILTDEEKTDEKAMSN